MRLSNIYQLLPDMEAAVAVMEHLRWGEYPECPHCQSQNTTADQQGGRRHCNNCNTTFSFKFGTFLEGSRLDLRKWLYAIWLFTSRTKTPRTMELVRELAVAKSTATYVAERIQTGLSNGDPLLSAIAEHMHKTSEIADDESLRMVRRKQSPRHAILPRGVGTETATLASLEVPVVILQDGRTVIQRSSFHSAVGRHPYGAGGVRLPNGLTIPALLGAKNLRAYLGEPELESLRPIRFLLNGRAQIGFLPGALRTVCEIFSRADVDGNLWRSQYHIAARCRTLIEALDARSDTSWLPNQLAYRTEGMRTAVVGSLARRVGPGMASWAGVLPDAFYEQLCRLRGWEYDEGKTAHPGVTARLVYDVVLSRLDSATERHLEKGITPGLIPVGGVRLLSDIAYTALREHVLLITSLMGEAVNWGRFYSKLQRRAPKHRDEFDALPTT